MNNKQSLQTEQTTTPQDIARKWAGFVVVAILIIGALYAVLKK